MAGDKITLGGKSRPLSENPIGEKQKKKKREPRQKLSVGTVKMFKVLLMYFGGWGHKVRGPGFWKSLCFSCIFPQPKLPAEEHGLKNCLQIRF